MILLTMSNRVRIKPEDIDRSDWDQPIDLERVRSVGWQRKSSETNGKLKKKTTDENNTTITEHWAGDRQDVLVRPKPVRMGVTTTS